MLLVFWQQDTIKVIYNPSEKMVPFVFEGCHCAATPWVHKLRIVFILFSLKCDLLRFFRRDNGVGLTGWMLDCSSYGQKVYFQWRKGSFLSSNNNSNICCCKLRGKLRMSKILSSVDKKQCLEAQPKDNIVKETIMLIANHDALLRICIHAFPIKRTCVLTL